MTKKYRSEAFAAIHETMETLHEIGAIDKQTMHEFDEACLKPMRTPEASRGPSHPCERHLSRPVF